MDNWRPPYAEEMSDVLYEEQRDWDEYQKWADQQEALDKMYEEDVCDD
jgi:hypothetical protein